MIRLDHIGKAHGRQVLFFDSSMGVFRGDTIGLVGPNGAGKSTILRMIVSEEEPDDGTIIVEKNVSVGYFRQDVGEMKGRSVLEETIAGAGEVATIKGELDALEAKMIDPAFADEMAELLERYGDVQGRFEELGGYGVEAKAQEILAGLGFSEDRVSGDVGALSGGWKMRVALARILLMGPDVLLLDEPTNHLDLESILWLEGFLKQFDGAIVMTSHDREFMNRLVTKIVDIDGGQLTTYTGDYEFYVQQRALGEKQQEAAFARQEAMLKKEREFIARFKARASHAAQVQSRVKKLEKIDTLEPPKKRRVVRFQFKEPKRSGDDVAKLAKVRKAFGEHVIYDEFDFLVRRQERWCVMGQNGAGKSTLLKMVSGESAPDDGRVAVGPSVTMAYFAQHAMDVLDGTLSVVQTIERAYPMASVGALKTLLGAFGFSGADADKKVGLLSGGEKSRLVLARMLYASPNFLVLDEPTNHLDLGTKEMLMEALAGYGGTMLFVSHDRAFLSAVANRVLELTPQGAVLYGGGYDEYVAQAGHEAPGMRA